MKARHRLEAKIRDATRTTPKRVMKHPVRMVQSRSEQIRSGLAMIARDIIYRHIRGGLLELILPRSKPLVTYQITKKGELLLEKYRHIY